VAAIDNGGQEGVGIAAWNGLDYTQSFSAEAVYYGDTGGSAGVNRELESTSCTFPAAY